MSDPSPRQPSHGGSRRTLTIRVEAAEAAIRRRYEAASIANDLLIAVWFLVGSVMFFSPDWQTAGTWCFVFGSVELLVRPVIRLIRHIHLLRMHGGNYAAQESSQDF